MSSEPSLPDLYRAYGFTVTPHLQALIDIYGETKVVSPMEPEKFSVMSIGRPVTEITRPQREIEFCPRVLIESGHDDPLYRDVGALLGSPVAPVGSLSTGEELMLTEDGRLVNEMMGYVGTWGPPGCDWRASVAAYLAGRKDRSLGSLDEPQPPEPSLAELYRERGYTLTPYLLALIETYGETARAPAGAQSVIDEDGRVDWNLAPKETIQFCNRNDIEVYSRGAAHSAAVQAHGKSVVPVGRTEDLRIVLFLTDDGHLICDDLQGKMMTWGAEGCDWRTSIAARLAGEPARELGWAGQGGKDEGLLRC